ncbi:MAG: hypothetical protein A2898_05555 [Candidatus Kerfeldbacteria bacterium RIFCSPLOWO2_01_FULL_48_11]|uniref:Uncharacterized protein n=1 Tax=Candidatus Kerfeldbacteria bacterium RIFCSPLOWO2_01_FULL_48_11 TaxID=1798543 RepID=A0A1G2B2Q8_9BACT|nr:MAG: hypothetical protein UY34_C0017G0013 [Parcubacteria group bacterium GW2011_GWA2_48_9]KKW16744.1 MAG: hypothetical protein UY52_C0001G0064 [Parcubacteria group bacterium GW2011_GWC2_49_9]OGY82470.1 MAG: hypothetical protein A2898_05555 [Candidatus Kerfeldbacteria bacterium RIFCSPLOWO2_01_FULL_48_11]HCJ52275.1 hypothetical protein [Candidatus Kerfeldbacteria bacterium]HCM68690.1 hypothetical protein [Candidatus Kerfeldbacteria bacterium]
MNDVPKQTVKKTFLLIKLACIFVPFLVFALMWVTLSKWVYDHFSLSSYLLVLAGFGAVFSGVAYLPQVHVSRLRKSFPIVTLLFSILLSAVVFFYLMVGLEFYF